MKQLAAILKFEFKNTAKSKMFIVLTVVGILAVSVTLSFPRLKAVFVKESPGTSQNEPAEKKAIAVRDLTGNDAQATAAFLNAALPAYSFLPTNSEEDTLKQQVTDGTYEGVILMESALRYRYLVETAGIMDTTTQTIDGVLTAKYRTETLARLGVSPEQTQNVLDAQVEGETVSIGKDQTQNFFYTYILIFLLYFAVIMYGNLVAQGVATEKSSRAMELLITSAKPTSLIFGKVLGIGLAGITQMVLILGSAYAFYHLNGSYWEGNPIVTSIFGMPLSMLLYTILFFVLGFFIYAFLFAALSSLASKLEEVNMLIQPVMWLFILAFLVTMFSMGSGNVDNLLMKVCSFLPFTSPMAMFTRIALGDVASWEILLSVAILIVSVGLIGYLSARIYRIGVLLYGNPPKPREIVRMLRNASAFSGGKREK